MLYTVVPLEQVYLPKAGSDTEPEMKQMETKNVSIKNGVVSLRREKDHYVVDNIWSTDMKDYLDDQYKPGSIMDI